MRYTGGVCLKPEKKGLVSFSAVLIAVIVAAAIIIPIVRRNSVSVYMREDLGNVDNISLIAHCSEVDGAENSVAGFKESVRLGANAVIVDLCFKKDGTPVMTDSYSEVDSAERVEALFSAMNEEKFNSACVYLNIVQLSDIAKLNSLAVEYNVVNRVFLTGIDSDRYELIGTDDTILPFLIDYTFTAEELESIKKGSFSMPEALEKTGASGLVTDYSQISDEVVETLNDYGILFIVDGIESNSDMCKALLCGANNVIVKDIKKSRETVDEWTLEMQNRYKESVDKSIKALSQKSKDR